MLVRYDRVNNRFGFVRRDCADLLDAPKETASPGSTQAPVPVPVPSSEPNGTEAESAGTEAPATLPPSPPAKVPSAAPPQGAGMGSPPPPVEGSEQS